MRFKLISPLRPAVLEGESDDYTYLIMPIRLAGLSRQLIVRHVTLRNYRSYASLDLDLSPGIVLVVGENGAGKTNLLEALHVGTQGFSPRTRTDGQLIRFGERGALGRSAARPRRRRARGPREARRAAAAKAAELDGSRLPSPSRCGASSRRSSSHPTGWPS